MSIGPENGPDVSYWPPAPGQFCAAEVRRWSAVCGKVSPEGKPPVHKRHGCSGLIYFHTFEDKDCVQARSGLRQMGWGYTSDGWLCPHCLYRFSKEMDAAS